MKILMIAFLGYLVCDGGTESTQPSEESTASEESTIFTTQTDTTMSQNNPNCPYTLPSCNSTHKFRSFSGTCNNLVNPLHGSANIPYRRFLSPDYDDGLNSPRNKSGSGNHLPSSRLISSTLLTPSDFSTKTGKINLFGVFFGQFVAHDLEKTAGEPDEIACCNPSNTDSESCFPIRIPIDDPFFGQFNKTCMNFVRSQYTIYQLQCTPGPREQITEVSGYLDSSNVYGSSLEEADALRLKQKGLMKVTRCDSDDLPPPDENNKTICSRERVYPHYSPFKAGDTRVNENPGLAVHHVIWLREHNRIAKSLARINPQWEDERLFQESRRIVIAEMQHIVYNEFLPLILGDNAMQRYLLRLTGNSYFTGYNESLDATPANSFSTAAYRFGHSMVSDMVLMLGGCFDLYRNCSQEQTLQSPGVARETCLDNRVAVPLRQVFDRPDTLYRRVTGIDATIQGMMWSRAQKVDNKLSREITNHLFEHGIPGHGMDLGALNVQRGRDHGIAAYNKWRMFCGLSNVSHWGTEEGGLVDHTQEVANVLQDIYSHPDDIDLFAAGVSEKPLKDSLTGPTFNCILGRQFQNIRLGDRFWFENPSPNPFTLEQLRSIKRIKYSRIITDNTGIFNIHNDAFKPYNGYSNLVKNRFELPKLNLNLWLEN